MTEPRYCKTCGQSLGIFGTCNFCDKDELDAGPLVDDDEPNEEEL